MILSTSVVLMLALIQADGAAEPIPETQVTGMIATRVEFHGAARVKLVEAALDLLESCQPTEWQEPPWDSASAEFTATCSYVHLRIDKPRTLAVGPEKIEARELFVLFPLAAEGHGIWVRVAHPMGDRARRFTKYSPARAVELQKLLKYANPID